MCLCGIGFGISRGAAFALLMIMRSSPSCGTARALWNRTYDAGYQASLAVFSVFVTCTRFPAVFAVAGMLMLAGLA